MLEGIICPDGYKIKTQDCLDLCRMGERCLPSPMIKFMTQEREWHGVPSTTQLLNGTMLEYLKLTQPYYVDLDKRAFMMQGSMSHKNLEEAAKELGLAAEIPLNVDRDIFDLIEVEDNKLVLTDYKWWGSYKVAKALGLEEIGKRPDPSGAVYQSNGKWGRKGDVKLVSLFGENPDLVDMWETEYQLNRYRILLADIGVIIHRMQLCIGVRDGGTYLAKGRGLLKNIYKIPIKYIEDEGVRAYFNFKAFCLEEALLHGWDKPCTPEENWNGARCDNYCEVASFCPRGKLSLSLKEE